MQIAWMVIVSLLIVANLTLSILQYGMLCRMLEEEEEVQLPKRLPMVRRRSSKWLG